MFLFIGGCTPLGPTVQRCYIGVDTTIEMEHTADCDVAVQYVLDAKSALGNMDIHELTFRVRDAESFEIAAEVVNGHFDPFANRIEITPTRPCIVIHELMHKLEWDAGNAGTFSHPFWKERGLYEIEDNFCGRAGQSSLWMPDRKYEP